MVGMMVVGKAERSQVSQCPVPSAHGAVMRVASPPLGLSTPTLNSPPRETHIPTLDDTPSTPGLANETRCPFSAGGRLS
jgi:hypothetical protein